MPLLQPIVSSLRQEAIPQYIKKSLRSNMAFPDFEEHQISSQTMAALLKSLPPHSITSHGEFLYPHYYPLVIAEKNSCQSLFDEWRDAATYAERQGHA
jgi:hypothetical protein